jgi:hypothetical protein
MSYSLEVGGPGSRNNKGRTIWEEYARTFRTGGTVNENDEYDRAFENLHLHNARDVPKTAYIEFETEADALAFKLKFS